MLLLNSVYFFNKTKPLARQKQVSAGRNPTLEITTINTNWKHFEELKCACLTARVLSIDEARDVISTKQLRENYHQQNSPKHHQQTYINTADGDTRKRTPPPKKHQKLTPNLIQFYFRVLLITLHSAQLCQLAVPRTKTCYGDRSFSVSGPGVWYSLPAALRCDDVTLLTFRARLKAALFNTSACTALLGRGERALYKFP